MRNWIIGGVFAFFTISCGDAGEGEPVASSAEPFSAPKGQMALTARSDTGLPDVFASWGWIYWNSTVNTNGKFEVLVKPASYPKALAALHASGDPHVFWIEGNRVLGKRRNTLHGTWEANFELSSASIAGGALTRLVGTAGPALVGLTSNRQIVVNWYNNGAWRGWCNARDLSAYAAEDADITAYRHNNGILAYAVDITGNNPVRPTLEVGWINRECEVDSWLHLDPMDPDMQRIFSARDNSIPDVYYLNSAGTLRRASLAQPTQPFTQPVGFRAFAHWPRLVSGVVRDRFYAIDAQGSTWQSLETVRPTPTGPANPNPGWQLME